MFNEKNDDDVFKEFHPFTTYLEISQFVREKMFKLKMSAIQINDDLEQNKITCEIALQRCQQEIVIL